MNNLSDVDYEDHVLRSRAHLEAIIGNKITTFAYPSGETDRGDGTNSFRTIIGKHMIGARGTTGGSTAVPRVNYLETYSMGTALDTGPTSRWARLEDKSGSIRSTYYRGWAVVLNHLVKDKVATIALFDFIKANESKYWVKPFSHVARYAQQRESSTLAVTSVTPGKIVFNLSDRMHDGLFNVPLTVKFRVNGWTAAAARQNGKNLPVRLVDYLGATYALVDATPDQGPVLLRATRPDADLDKISDLWESEHGLNPADPDDALLDTDGDEDTNLAEFLADTDPTNPMSRTAKWLERSAEGIQFAYSPVPVWATPLVDISTDLVTWTPLIPSLITQEGEVTRWLDSTSPITLRFYRLKLTATP
jgi:hypothetical protein